MVMNLQFFGGRGSSSGVSNTNSEQRKYEMQDEQRRKETYEYLKQYGIQDEIRQPDSKEFSETVERKYYDIFDAVSKGKPIPDIKGSKKTYEYLLEKTTEEKKMNSHFGLYKVGTYDSRASENVKAVYMRNLKGYNIEKSNIEKIERYLKSKLNK